MSVQQYRRSAADCLRLASITSDPEVRARLRRMAVSWADLAEKAEAKLSNSVKPTPALQQRRPQKAEKRPFSSVGLRTDKCRPNG